MIRLVILVALTSVARAHPAPMTEVTITRGTPTILAMRLPASELAHVNVTTSDQVAAYLPRHITSNWELALGPVRSIVVDGHPYWETTVTVTGDGALVLYDDAITHEVRNHYIVMHDGSETRVLQYPQRLLIGSPRPLRRTWVRYAAVALGVLGVLWLWKRRH